MISGASSGSIVATLYAAGYNADEIYKFFKKYAKDIRYVDLKNIFKLIYGLIFKNEIAITGLTVGKKLEEYVKKMCMKKGIANIKFGIEHERYYQNIYNEIITKIKIPDAS